MGLSIEGWVEISWDRDVVAPQEHRWMGVINLGSIIQVGDEISTSLFGLSKSYLRGLEATIPLACGRGVPSNPSPNLQRDMQAIVEFEKRYPPGEYGGYTWATWDEISTRVFDENILNRSDWKVVFEMIRALPDRYLPNQIRIVCWFVW